MKNKAVDIDSYLFKRRERLLFDANIWLYLFPPPGGRRRESTVYSDAFKRAILAECEIYLDAVVLGEFVNRSFRIRAPLGQGQDAKDFRKSADFAKAAEDVCADARQIIEISHVRIADTEFASFDLGEALREFESGRANFNDALIMQKCRLNKLKLVTHDRDFVEGGIDVLTWNHRLLTACS